jgi:hypothetical protein
MQDGLSWLTSGHENARPKPSWQPEITSKYLYPLHFADFTRSAKSPD